MSERDAKREFQDTKKSFLELMETYKRNPKCLRSDLSACEIDSLAHVDPSVNYDEGGILLSGD